MTRISPLAIAAASLVAAASLTAGPAAAQSAPFARPASPDRGAVTLRRAVDGLTTTARVLVVGMHPDDDLPGLDAWLSLGRHVETGFLAITRGESADDFNGPETGASLGVVRVAESLAARRIDGAHQYFTRAYDFGPARSARDVFRTPLNDTAFTGHWDRDSVLADLVTVIRAARPQVIVAVAGDTTPADAGQHRALEALLDTAFVAAADSARFPVEPFGAVWSAAKLYRLGPGIRLPLAERDAMLGRSYASLGGDARAAQRSQGGGVMSRAIADTLQLTLAASRVGTAAADTALFAGVDTSFARLGPDTASNLGRAVRALSRVADSLRATIDVSRPADAVETLSRLADLASSLRVLVPSCGHVSPFAAITPRPPRRPPCGPGELDRDAAVDLVHERANAALLAAAAVDVSATADRELLAPLDTAIVTVSIANHGASPIRLGALSVSGAIPDSADTRSIEIAPRTTLTLIRRIVHLESADGWWLGRRSDERFPDAPWPRDGLRRTRPPPDLLVPAEAVAEDLRRVSDVSLLLAIGEATIATTIGPVLHSHADAVVGLQHRPVSGAPEATLRFARTLEWFPTNRPVNRVLHVTVQSYADHPLVLGLGKAAEPGIVVDALPKEVRLEPREQRDLLLPIRGTIPQPVREQFLFWAVTAQMKTYQMSLQSIARDYLEPQRVPHATGAYLQGVDVVVPAGLTVFYVPEGVDDIRSTLTQIGVEAREISPDVLLTADLSRISTIVLAPHAIERFPEIGAQANRLLEFVRRGGTLVVQRGGDTTLASKLLPFPVQTGGAGDAVLQPDAPVDAVGARPRLLDWPNRITRQDWDTWVAARAESVPAGADARYGRVIETHDPGQPANNNAILVARVGRGTVIYTSLTFDRQIAGASTGALRLFVNLLSAGLPPR